MKALILSGGTGTRLRPLTYSNAKQLLPLANKPILFYIIEKIKSAGIKDIGIIVGNTHEQVKKAVGKGERWDVDITYIYQPQSLGLAHAVKTASGFLEYSDFMMILGDNIFKMDLDILIDNFVSNKANTSVLLHKVNNPSQYGVAVINNGYVIKLVEKPKGFLSDLIITGVYMFDHNIFSAIEKTTPSLRGELEITDAIQKQLEMGGKVTYELVKGWWKDTGMVADILEANRLVLDEIIEYQGAYNYDSSITGKVIIGKNVSVKDSIIQGPVHIDDDSIIKNSFVGPYTSLGKGTIVNECEIDNCIVLENTHLENVNKRISESLIGKNVSIKGSLKKLPSSNSFFVGDDSEINFYD
jgi:glucose-1-phosphate thymidylyltransferase